jgi:hypothetical protein
VAQRWAVVRGPDCAAAGARSLHASCPSTIRRRWSSDPPLGAHLAMALAG